MMTLGHLAPLAVEWALTYLLHSTVLLGLVGLATRARSRSDVWRETLWRGALLGSVLTATLATSLPFSPAAGRIEVPGIGAGTASIAAPEGQTGEVASEREAPGSTGPVVPDPRASSAASPLPNGMAPGWSTPALVAWAGVSAALLALLALRNVRLFRRLRGRRRLTDGPLASTLTELRRHAGVWRPIRLSVSASCSTPLVIGSSEICVPPRFLDDLGAGEQRAALAHELAHIRRRDPHWQLGTGILGALLFFQPLNLLARLRLRESSERLCDDWAIRLTGSPLRLGRCLTEIASWSSPASLPPLGGTPAMAEGGSPLLERIGRIRDGVPSAPELRLGPFLVATALLLATAGLAPVVGGESGVGDPASPGAPEGTGRPGAAVADPASPGTASDTLEAVALLEELAMNDPSARVREEAAAELSDWRHPAARGALARIVRRASDPEVRATAASQLDAFPTDDVVGVLLEVAFEDPVADVRESALYTLEDFDMEAARAALRRVAREHPLPEMRSAALHALGGGG